MRVNLDLPRIRSGFRRARIGSTVSPHLQPIVESICVNMGGSHMEMSSPSRKYASVGGVIVLGARENRAQGEGRQPVGKIGQNNRMLTRRNR
jgi:hypothetical protein